VIRITCVCDKQRSIGLYPFSGTQIHCRGIFDGTDGASPNPVIQGTDGKFYGSANLGGTSDLGTVFRLDTGLRSFVSFLPPLALRAAGGRKFGKAADLSAIETELAATTAFLVHVLWRSGYGALLALTMPR
jgi:uncharacterized repeat protein (TIGR03803 family)